MYAVIPYLWNWNVYAGSKTMNGAAGKTRILLAANRTRHRSGMISAAPALFT